MNHAPINFIIDLNVQRSCSFCVEQQPIFQF